jgi:hypothetical protein
MGNDSTVALSYFDSKTMFKQILKNNNNWMNNDFLQ